MTHKRIEDLYEEKFKTQKELALATGLSKDEISRIIKRQTMNISHGSIIKFAKVFGVSSDYLLGLTNIRFQKQIEMEQLGLSEQGIRVLAANQINGKIISRLLTDQGFCYLMNLAHAYFQRRKSWNNDFVAQGKKNYIAYKKEHPIKHRGYDEAVPEFDTYRDQDEERELMDLTKRFEQAMKRIRKSYDEKEPEVGNTPEEVSDAYFAYAKDYIKRKEEGREEITIINGIPIIDTHFIFRQTSFFSSK